MSVSAVRRIEPPGRARSGSGLACIDYCDAFLTTPQGRSAADHDAVDWARHVLAGSGRAVSEVLVLGWRGLGLRIHPGRSGAVLGWEVREQAPDRVLLEATSRIGMPAELLFERVDGDWLFATRVQLDSAAVRALWSGVTPMHLLAVGLLLRRAARSTHG